MKKLAIAFLYLGLGPLSAQAKGPSREIPFEVQIRICSELSGVNPSWDELRRRFELGRSELQTFSTWFLDTPTLELNDKGLTLRLREPLRSGEKTEFVVKSWVKDARRVLESWWDLEDFKCETNFYPGPIVNDQCDLKTRTRLPRSISELAVSQLLKGFSRDQKAFLHDLGGLQTLPSSLRLLGPLKSVKIKGAVEIDQWILPDGTRDTEISQKTLQTPEVTLLDLRERLRGSGFVLCPEQRGRTRRALEALQKHDPTDP
jgi:hypothetical protein